LNPSHKFNKEFGLKLTDRLDGTYYSLVILSVTFSAVLVLIFSQLNYTKLTAHADQLIRSRYKDFAAQFIIEDIPQKFSSSSISIESESPTKSKLSKKEKLVKEIDRTVERIVQSGTSQSGINKVLSDELPDVDDFIGNLNEIESGQLTHSGNGWPSGNSNGTRDGVNNLNPGDIDDLLKRPFNYILNRRGSMYIDLTKELIEEPDIKRGYRDPREIERIIEQNQPMIEHCFRKEARQNQHLKGFVKVEFRISFEGYVIPESIRIVNSTVRSRKVEKCIKTYIRRWRNFSRLDEEMGIARVVQKFVFN